MLFRSSDICGEPNGATRQRLERQQENIYEQMDKTAKICDELQAELQQLPEHQECQAKKEALKNLNILLNTISLDKFIKAYRLCCPEVRISRITYNNKENLVRQLAEMPEEKERLNPLFLVVKTLSQDNSLSSEQQQDLQRWLKAQGLPPETLVNDQEQIQIVQIGRAHV